MVCLIYTEAFEVRFGSVLDVIGSKPLFVASIGSIKIDGRVDVSSRNGLRGAGSNSSKCLLVFPAGNSTGGGGGGAGGSFQGMGGNGGLGNASGIGTFGASAAMPGGLPDKLRGGCGGSSGGRGADPSVPSDPGAGGGAIAFLSAVSFTVSSTGTLFANGSGAGRGIRERGGAAGGGSGGMITMTAPSVILQGLVLAEGGGGGGGANSSQDGLDGKNPTKISSGAGGQGAILSNGGDGGEGSTTASRGQHAGIEGIDGDEGRRGGGGGGGGAGYLIVKANTLQIGSSSPGITLVTGGP